MSNSHHQTTRKNVFNGLIGSLDLICTISESQVWRITSLNNYGTDTETPVMSEVPRIQSKVTVNTSAMIGFPVGGTTTISHPGTSSTCKRSM